MPGASRSGIDSGGGEIPGPQRSKAKTRTISIPAARPTSRPPASTIAHRSNPADRPIAGKLVVGMTVSGGTTTASSTTNLSSIQPMSDTERSDSFDGTNQHRYALTARLDYLVLKRQAVRGKQVKVYERRGGGGSEGGIGC